MTAPDDELSAYASPACSLHELAVDDAGLAVSPQAQAANIARWRRAKRAELIARRLALGADVRMEKAQLIASSLDRLIAKLAPRIVAAYWPIRGEPDLRAWMAQLTARGAQSALPVVVEKRSPVVFRTWRAGEPLDRGIWDIPIPRHGRLVVPDVIVAPLVGFDTDGFRLGYGAGYYDRTLAALVPRPFVVGVGYADQALPTIYPQSHDIAMAAIVTEGGIVSAAPYSEQFKEHSPC